ncbi:MAG: DUF116 domain-containing protein [Acidobacteriota bacterium]
MRVLPAAGQTGSFLADTGGWGAYHWVRVGGSLLLAGAGLAGLFFIFFSRPSGFGCAILGGAAGALALAAAAYLTGILLPFSRWAPRLWIRSYAMLCDRVFLRILLRAVRIVGDKTDPVLRSYVRANNAAVRSLYRRRKPENILILLPHCVVYSRCPKKVVKDLSRCTDCDLCQMEGILGLSDRSRLPTGIAVRSAEAYSQARALGPDLTLAVACDDRLVKGITRVPELPAFALPLHLPEESCHDNLVDMGGLREAMSYFLGPARMAGQVQAAPARPPVPGARLSRRIRLPGVPAGKGLGAPTPHQG